jgi:hypothetical protein
MGRILAAMLLVGAGIVGALAVAVAFGNGRWDRESERYRDELEAAAAAFECPRRRPPRYSPEVLTDLPAPVQAYFRRVLTPGQPLVARARVRHEGEFALKPNEWRPFTSQQLYTVGPPGFVWDASIEMMPLFPVRVRDRYFGGHASMLGAVAGIVKMVDQSGTPGLAAGALLRYLAEGVWFPTSLLPCEGVQWTAIDDSTARATLADGSVRVSMDAHFAPTGELLRVTAMRDRDVNGTSVPTLWEGHHSRELRSVDGMQIPVSGEVAWLLPEGRHAYWRGRVVEARYDFRPE